jgi:hypothetical protein
MRIVAKVANALGSHSAQVATENVARSLSITPKPSGYGSSVNGGELLFAEDLAALLKETDRVAEIQNTVRHGCTVTFEGS